MEKLIFIKVIDPRFYCHKYFLKFLGVFKNCYLQEQIQTPNSCFFIQVKGEGDGTLDKSKLYSEIRFYKGLTLKPFYKGLYGRFLFQSFKKGARPQRL